MDLFDNSITPPALKEKDPSFYVGMSSAQKGNVESLTVKK
jgi:hypothetical protein